MVFFWPTSRLPKSTTLGTTISGALSLTVRFTGTLRTAPPVSLVLRRRLKLYVPLTMRLPSALISTCWVCPLRTVPDAGSSTSCSLQSGLRLRAVMAQQ